MIIKYKGTDEHGVFRMGVTKLPNDEELHSFLDAHPEYEVKVEQPGVPTWTFYPKETR